MFELGGWYLTGANDSETGFHLEQSYSESMRWVAQAAAQGLPRALFAMGYFYENGIGVVPDMTLAWLWYDRAAQSGDPKAVKKMSERPAASINTNPAPPVSPIPHEKKNGRRSSVNVSSSSLASTLSPSSNISSNFNTNGNGTGPVPSPATNGSPISFTKSPIKMADLRGIGLEAGRRNGRCVIF